MNIDRTIDNIRRHILPVAWNLAVVAVIYTICRVVYLLENYASFADMPPASLLRAFAGGVRFDWAAMCYGNSLYVLLMLMPAALTDKRWYQLLAKTYFIVVNAVCWSSNLIDSVYFPFVGRRATATVFSEFGNDNLTGVFTGEFISHFYLIIVFAVLLWLQLRLYCSNRGWRSHGSRWLSAVRTLLFVLLWAGLVVAGVRGGFDPELRPINLRDAKEYTDSPRHAALVLNTPFSIFRTIQKKAFPTFEFYTPQQLDAIYSPVHQPTEGMCGDTLPNVCIIILESFGTEYSSYLNGGREGYMPFLDSLMIQGLTFGASFANGRTSIDGQASVLASIPMLVESYFTSHAAMNDISGMGNEMKARGYSTYYFHGADNGSLGIDAFARNVGFDHFYGRTEFNNNADTEDYDHRWGIWDEPFLQFMADRMDKAQQPFLAGVFTLTSHHPFQIPVKYKDVYPEGELAIHKCIRYTDMALQRFFEAISAKPWFRNTLFVITGDHTNQTNHLENLTEYGRFRVPIVFYHPTDVRFHGRSTRLAQHIDIMPTILNYIGTERPYVAFGKDLLQEPESPSWVVEYCDGAYIMIDAERITLFDGERVIAAYDYSADPFLQNNLAAETIPSSLPLLKAIMQSYMTRMNENKLVVSK